MFFRERLNPCERKPFSLPEKAVLSMGESRFVYQRKPFCLLEKAVFSIGDYEYP